MDRRDQTAVLLGRMMCIPALHSRTIERTHLRENHMADTPDHDATETEIAAPAVKQTEADEHFRPYVEAGWIPDKHGGLCDPDDPELNVWRDPETHEVFLSPKLVEQLKSKLPPKQQ